MQGTQCNKDIIEHPNTLSFPPLILPYDPVAYIDHQQAQKFRDEEHVHIAGAGEGAANAGKKSADSDKYISFESGLPVLLSIILYS